MGVFLGGVFFVSGAAALVFETLWFHQAGLTFGNSVWASSLVLASFMTGLAFGNALAARLGHRLRRPLVAYSGLEVVVGVSGLALVWGLPHLSGVLAPALRPHIDSTWILNLLRLVFCFGLLLVPSTAMGATLPIVVRALTASVPGFGAALGRLYGWNTLGAVAGALSSELVLIERFGIRGSAVFAAALDGVAALGALLLARTMLRRRAPKAARREASRGATSAPRSGSLLLLLSAAALAGAIILGLEVVWFRFMLLFVHAGSIVFAIMLAVVLAGISIGGFLAALWSRHQRDAHRGAALVALLAGTSVVVLYRAFGAVHSPYGNAYIWEPTTVAWLSIALMLPGSILSGLLFTFIGAALRERTPFDTRAVGLLTLANTLGAALGALLAGFAGLPLLGMERCFFAAALLYGLTGLLLIPTSRTPAGGRNVRLGYAGLGLLIVAVATFPFGRMERRYFAVPVQRYDPEALRLSARGAASRAAERTPHQLRRRIHREGPHRHTGASRHRRDRPVQRNLGNE
jgi:MFS family permease